jgi:ribosomal protein S18 acetylase RimI-like enzyme
MQRTKKGGVFGKILKAEEKGTPHGLIDCLWVYPHYRSKKLGTVLMEEAEKLFRQQGAKYIQLATNGFQAPEFYRKMGFELSRSAPGYYALCDGQYDIFDCTKKL